MNDGWFIPVIILMAVQTITVCITIADVAGKNYTAAKREALAICRQENGIP